MTTASVHILKSTKKIEYKSRSSVKRAQSENKPLSPGVKLFLRDIHLYDMKYRFAVWTWSQLNLSKYSQRESYSAELEFCGSYSIFSIVIMHKWGPNEYASHVMHPCSFPDLKHFSLWGGPTCTLSPSYCLRSSPSFSSLHGFQKVKRV